MSAFCKYAKRWQVCLVQICKTMKTMYVDMQNYEYFDLRKYAQQWKVCFVQICNTMKYAKQWKDVDQFCCRLYRVWGGKKEGVEANQLTQADHCLVGLGRATASPSLLSTPNSVQSGVKRREVEGKANINRCLWRELNTFQCCAESRCRLCKEACPCVDRGRDCVWLAQRWGEVCKQADSCITHCSAVA